MPCNVYTPMKSELIEKDLPLFQVEQRRSHHIERVCFWCIATFTGVVVLLAALTVMLEYGDQVISAIDSRLPEWAKSFDAAPSNQGDVPLIVQIVAPPQFVEGNPKILQVWFNAQNRAASADNRMQALLQPIDYELPVEQEEEVQLLPQPEPINRESIGSMIEEIAKWEDNQY
uniref:Nematode cuticle collagen N-terminal domain-containing protein n=1 Tax=Trichuris muris TaxID=70415 RepID=A0A5S6QCF5_TRIMR